MNNSEIITVKNLTKKYPMGLGEFTALNDMRGSLPHGFRLSKKIQRKLAPAKP